MEIPIAYVDDASRLNRTVVAEVWQIPVDHIYHEAQIVKLLEKARAEGKHVSIAGAQHSMGGTRFILIRSLLICFHGTIWKSMRNVIS